MGKIEKPKRKTMEANENTKNKVLTIFVSTIFFGTMFIVITPTKTKADYLDEEGWAIIAAPPDTRIDTLLEVLALRSYLKEHGWRDSHIIFLIDEKDWYFVDGDATKANIKKGIEYIAKHATNNDTVFIGILNRGSKGKDYSYFETKDGILKDSDLGKWIDWIKCKEMVIEISASYSGGFIDDCKGNNRLIVCSHAENQFTLFNFYRLSRGLKSTDADIDNNGRISVEEAHLYEKKNIKGKQTPVSWYHNTEGEIYPGIE